MNEGVAVDLDSPRITDKLRRRPVTGVTEAMIGFQHGRCLICREPVVPGSDVIAVDHVFPFSLMERFPLTADLDAVWNLVPAHAGCNLGRWQGFIRYVLSQIQSARQADGPGMP
ncbi:HNH endonuclease domain-containing protein [Microbispora sp. H13382]|uniref:HNH endonuclease domain-containing protein n=1 Tax=Microbispora sp. H13382 TaxID=2729112 RepID=UPI0016031ED5|nr:HNH endonuclease domain-containing protein [Microbispora sp. H13382]